MRKLLLILSLFVAPMAFSQPNFEWANQLEGAGTFDYGYGIHCDTLGNVYSVGSFQGTTDFDPSLTVLVINTVGSNDVFIQKVDLSGNLIWAKTLGSTGSDVASDIVVDSLGFIYVVGSFTGTVDFDPGLGTFNMFAGASNTDVFILKLDNNGNFIWAKKIGGTQLESAQKVKLDHQGNIICIGSFSSTNVDFDPGPGTFLRSTLGNVDFFILKLNASGDFIWAQSIGGTDFDYAEDISIDSQNNLVIVGSFESTVDFDPNGGTFFMNAQSSTNADGFILKLDASGNFLWSKDRGNGSDQESTFAVAIDNSDRITVGSQFRNTIVTEAQSFTSAGSADLLIEQFSILGSVLWQIQQGGVSGESINNIITDQNNNFICIGGFGANTDLYPSGIGGELTSNGASDIFIMKMNNMGGFLWSKNIGGIADDIARSNFIDESNNLHIIGNFQNTVDFDTEVGIQNLTSIAGHDVFVVKYSICSDIFTPVNALLSDIISSCFISSIQAPTASNACGATIVGVSNITFPIAAQGTTVVTWTYDDGNGNTSTQTQNVIIDDATAPIADAANLSDITSECEVTSLIAPTATDNCAGTITATHDATLPITVQGTTIVTWTYDDGNGNTSTQTQNVIIDDVTTPISDAANLSNITSECGVTSLSAPTATDNCAGTFAGTHNATLPITGQGTTVVTWTYDDGNGNTSTQTQNVVITPIDNGITQVDALTLNADASGYNYQWIDCDNGNQPINGATNQTFVATVNGNYAVEIDNGTCMVVSACMIIDEVNIKEIWKTELVEVYPNPTTGTLNIESTVDIQSIELMDALGQLIKIYTANENKIEINTAPGVYFLRITVGGIENIIRVVKQ